jgi:hypothetical protein
MRRRLEAKELPPQRRVCHARLVAQDRDRAERPGRQADLVLAALEDLGRVDPGQVDPGRVDLGQVGPGRRASMALVPKKACARVPDRMLRDQQWDRDRLARRWPKVKLAPRVIVRRRDSIVGRVLIVDRDRKALVVTVDRDSIVDLDRKVPPVVIVDRDLIVDRDRKVPPVVIVDRDSIVDLARIVGRDLSVDRVSIADRDRKVAQGRTRKRSRLHRLQQSPLHRLRSR